MTFPSKRPASLSFRASGRRMREAPEWVKLLAALGLLVVIFWLIRAGNMP